MSKFIKFAMISAACASVVACSATEEEVGNIVGFALATEVLRQTPAVERRFAAPAAPSARFSDVRNTGTVQYTGQIALYDDHTALDDAALTELPTPDAIGRMDITTNVGDTNGTLTGTATNVVRGDGTALTGTLNLDNGNIGSIVIVGRGEFVTLDADLRGSLTDESGTLPYNTDVTGTFADTGESLFLEGATDGTDNAGNGFSAIIGAVRD